MIMDKNNNKHLKYTYYYSIIEYLRQMTYLDTYFIFYFLYQIP